MCQGAGRGQGGSSPGPKGGLPKVLGEGALEVRRCQHTFVSQRHSNAFLHGMHLQNVLYVIGGGCTETVKSLMPQGRLCFSASRWRKREILWSGMLFRIGFCDAPVADHSFWVDHSNAAVAPGKRKLAVPPINGGRDDDGHPSDAALFGGQIMVPKLRTGPLVK